MPPCWHYQGDQEKQRWQGQTIQVKQTICQSTQAHQRQSIHYHLQPKCIHLIKCTKVLKWHGISIHPSHHSPFTIPVQAAHSGVLSWLLPSNHPQLPFPLPQPCCCNTRSCDNIGRTLVLFLNCHPFFSLQIILVQIPPFRSIFHFQIITLISKISHFIKNRKSKKIKSIVRG